MRSAMVDEWRRAEGVLAAVVGEGDSEEGAPEATPPADPPGKSAALAARQARGSHRHRPVAPCCC